MEIKQFVWDLVDSNSWLIKEGNNGLLIDAIDNCALYEELIKLDSLTIVLTHSHFDHIIGLNQIRELRPDSKVISTRLCSENLGNIYKNMSSSATAFMVFYSGENDIEIKPFTCKSSEEEFDEEYVFEWYGHHVELSAYRGHSLDSLIALINGRIMFSGDTVLPLPTVTRFPSGSTERFWKEDVPKMKKMDSELPVYPGHGTRGTLGSMLLMNRIPKRYIIEEESG